MTRFALALDLGGTKVEAALVDETGAVVPGSRSRRPTGAKLTENRLQGSLVQIIRTVLSNPLLADGAEPVVGVGIGAAGPIDHSAGTIFPVNMPGVHGMALKAYVAEVAGSFGAAGVPVCLGHDGGCLALAEAWVGATQGARASMSFVVSTGIGGGFVIDGRHVGGASGNAGHLGQTHIDDLTLEEVASGPASVAWARGQGFTGTTGEELAAAAASGDAVARAAIERSATAVGLALADAATLFDLDVIAVGGGFSHVSDDYVDMIGLVMRERAALPYAAAARVVRSGLGSDGPLIGAAAPVFAPLAP